MARRSPPLVEGREIVARPQTARRDWRAQRIGVALMLAFVAAALAVLLGGGPLSRARIEQDGLVLEYERIVRRRAPTTLQITAAGSAGPARRLGLQRGFVDAVDPLAIEPLPRAAVSGAAWQTYTVALAPGGTVRVSYTPRRIGARQQAIRIDDGPPLVFRQVVLP